MTNEEGRGVLFYRCNLCTRPVSPWDVDRYHGCPYCGHTKIRPTNLTLWEKLVQILRKPDVWNWRKFAC